MHFAARGVDRAGGDEILTTTTTQQRAGLLESPGRFSPYRAAGTAKRLFKNVAEPVDVVDVVVRDGDDTAPAPEPASVPG